MTIIRMIMMGVGMSLLLTGCDHRDNQEGYKLHDNKVMVTSVSSDGQYAITTNMNEHAYLWDLVQHTYRRINQAPINIYSAYFIPQSNDFMYQRNDNDEVIIENVNGDIVKRFKPGFPSYGEVITTDLINYIAADEDFNVYQVNLLTQDRKQLAIQWCYQDHHGQNYQGTLPNHCTAFGAEGKLFNFNISHNQDTVIGSANGSLFIWNIHTGDAKQLKKLTPQTFNTISSDGQEIIITDQARGSFIYNLQQNKIIPNKNDERAILAIPQKNTRAENYFYDKYGYKSMNNIIQANSVKFIDDTHFLVGFRGSPLYFFYLGLYELNHYSYKPIDDTIIPYMKLSKYLPLVKEPLKIKPNTLYPETRSFIRSQAMDTSPSAHVLVMGQANGGGIMVYHYDPEQQSLTLVWAPMLKPELPIWLEYGIKSLWRHVLII